MENIKHDFGYAALHRAIEACRKHAGYYASLGNGNLRYVERLVGEYKESEEA